MPAEALDQDIERLAREASARDVAREALAIALEWPEEHAARPQARGARWKGWLALAGPLVLAAVAAAIAVSLAPADPPRPSMPSIDNDGLRLERQLSVPAAPARHAAD